MISGAFALPHMPDDSMQLRSSLVLLQLYSQQVLALVSWTKFTQKHQALFCNRLHQ